ncbi:hypothetical protein AMATHDRAFT_147193 [Amanita thiersii Skay4041]|uniref:Uncharacterized protein n=1 Tax=Amanita thiersii Skay4041 TaxID=703135 RepID=A0A2A9NPL0_9AGAR|nr:hypothetical protein AMATHDRAFT_147193 [Amanita thiersii Skay4041]
MSERDAKVVTNLSNRATPTFKDRKVAYRGALDTPFRIQWPKVPLSVQNSVLTEIISALRGVADYHNMVRQLNRKRKKAQRSLSPNQKQKIDMEAETTKLPGTQMAIHDDNESDGDDYDSDVPDIPAHTVVTHLVAGLNQVTKRLESQVRSVRSSSLITTSTSQPHVDKKPDLCFIVACRADVDPPFMIDHLPHLVAAYNSLGSNSIRLVTLPKGSEATLAEVFGVRRVTVIGLDVDFPHLKMLNAIAEAIPVLTAPWLSRVSMGRGLIPTHVKQVHTTVPRDMKAAREQKLKEKALKKGS